MKSAPDKSLAREIVVDRRQLADLLGVSTGHVSRLVAQGLPCLTTGGGRGKPSRFDAVAALAWMRERQAAADAPNGDESPRDAYLRALKERVELDIAVRRGELVSLDTVTLAGQAYTVAWRRKLLRLPHQCQHAGVPPEYCDVVARLGRDLLEDVARWKVPDDESD
jgi:phage terminase Nu1 subunit (DNA packaging protein)